MRKVTLAPGSSTPKLVEALSQPASGSKQTHLQGALARGQAIGQLLDRDAFGAGHQKIDDLGILVIERGEHHSCLGNPLCLLMRIIFSSKLHGDLERLLVSHGSSPQMITSSIGRNSPDPGREGARVAKPVQSRPRLECDLLSQILRSLRASNTTGNQSRAHLVLVHLEQLAKGLCISGLRTTSQQLDPVPVLAAVIRDDLLPADPVDKAQPPQVSASDNESATIGSRQRDPSCPWPESSPRLHTIRRGQSVLPKDTPNARPPRHDTGAAGRKGDTDLLL